MSLGKRLRSFEQAIPTLRAMNLPQLRSLVLSYYARGSGTLHITLSNMINISLAVMDGPMAIRREVEFSCPTGHTIKRNFLIVAELEAHGCTGDTTLTDNGFRATTRYDITRLIHINPPFRGRIHLRWSMGQWKSGRKLTSMALVFTREASMIEELGSA